MSQLLPGWKGTSEADPGIALAELIAYVGDRFSYEQDAIATEAYLATARSRISLRRHALLVDYHVSDGCNARAWVHVEVSGNPGDKVFLDRTLTRFYTYAPGMPSKLGVNDHNEEAAILSGTQVFEPMWDQVLFPEHNQLSFYTWGDENCCLPRGATEATLRGAYPNLQPGDVLIFQEMVGPRTGDATDADMRHRCAVRLINVTTVDGAGQPLVDPLFEEGTGAPITSPAQKPAPVTEIRWAEEDALSFPVCVSSSFVDDAGETHSLKDVSVVFGNIVLADHGISLSDVDLGTAPEPTIVAPATGADPCNVTASTPFPVRFRPHIPDANLTQAVPFTAKPITGLGNPHTTGAVRLQPTGPVSLPNAEGFPCLTLQATNPAGWPSSFGVVVAANAATPANLDLSVVYDSPNAGSGVKTLVTLESFTNVSLDSTDANYVVTRVNGISNLIEVLASFAPPAASLPAKPTLLTSSGPVSLQDSGGNTFLTLQVTDTAAWPALFGVTAQPGSSAAVFDLAVVYDPVSGGSGVPLPVTVESFSGLTLEGAATAVNGASGLITIATFAATADGTLSARALMRSDAEQAVPSIALRGIEPSTTHAWSAKLDLLESGESDLHFVVEVESDGIATLRFGDDTNGRRPESGTRFLADYRIGNGHAGNVGADSLIYHAGDPRIDSCRNPLPAKGGADPESSEQIRRRAPQAFVTQERAVTMTDYQTVAEQHPLVNRAVARPRWTGSWYTVFMAVEPRDTAILSPALEQAVTQKVERYHLAGQDLELDDPQYVSLDIALEVCVDPSYLQMDVQQALEEVLGSGTSPSGVKGFFHPDNFTFGQTVYLGPIYAAARRVAGVRSVRAARFQPQGTPDTTTCLDAGEIKVASLQIARLDNNRNYPDHGKLSLTLEGGK
jgi:hypothetical protein